MMMYRIAEYTVQVASISRPCRNVYSEVATARFNMLRVLMLATLSCCLLFTTGTGQKDLEELIGRDVLITMQVGTRNALNQVSRTRFINAAHKRTFLREALVRNADSSQASLLEALKELGTGDGLTSFWLTNQVHVKNATKDVLDMLRNRVDVSRVDRELRFVAVTGELCASRVAAAPLAPGYNLQLIRAPELWAEGVNGTGIVVGFTGTGVRHTHEVLRDSYKDDEYSWYDPVTFTPTPYDHNGHGTTIAALTAGGPDIGVAPGIKWIACKFFDADGVAALAGLIDCAQFMFCPTHTDGRNADCTQAPRVILNIYNLPDEKEQHFFVVDLIAGILNRDAIVVNSVGDFGGVKECGSVGFPANLDGVLAVGVTDAEDALWAESSRGPSRLEDGDLLLKPEISAPGVGVVSACDEADDCYSEGSSTSLAAAMVAGAIALLLSADPSLNSTQVRAAMQATASKSLRFTGAECGGVPDSQFPNFHFGHGRLDVYAAYELLKAAGPGGSSGTPQLLWFTLGGVAAGVLLIMVVVTLALVCSRRRRANGRRLPETPALDSGDSTDLHVIIQQFRSGVWPQLVTLQYLQGDDSNSSSEVANYVALSQPYDFQQYEIDEDCLEIDSSHVLGSGEFGVVCTGLWLGRTSGDEPRQVAVKRLKPGADASCVAVFLRELQVVVYVGEHENIVQLLGAFTQTTDVGHLCMVMELCPNGNLETYLQSSRATFGQGGNSKRTPSPSVTSVQPPRAQYVLASSVSAFAQQPEPLSTADLLRWTHEISTGMTFLAQKRVIHGDIACRNVLLDENLVAKVSDFGLASRLYEYASRSVREESLLPWRWMALEALKEMRFSTASDVWSFGVTMWEVFSLAEVPYPGCVWGEGFVRQLADGYRNLRPVHASEELFGVMERCWEGDWRQRPSMEEVRQRLGSLLGENKEF